VFTAREITYGNGGRRAFHFLPEDKKEESYAYDGNKKTGDI
jgi:hypothetical protein